jgi:tRNA(Ile)-lysidine synthase
VARRKNLILSLSKDAGRRSQSPEVTGVVARPDAPEGGRQLGPLSAAEFDRLMQAVGPFEARPRIAVAVSGGGDSMALALLAAEWGRSRGAAVVALTVDHGLRPEAAAEARRVGRWLKARGIAHRILRWQPPAALRGGLQAAARAARYRLATEWCRRHGALHLALAHHREDQAETFLLRLARGSGLDGLAAMAAIAERDGVRLVRPLLAVGRARLRATLAERGQPWLEDPSNENPAHARVRMRRLLPVLAAAGLDAAQLAAASAHLGRARAALDDQVATLLAVAAVVFPAGYIRLDPAPLRTAPAEVALRALARCLLTVGGADYAPRLARLARLHDAIRADRLGGGATLGGCRVLPRRAALLICREPAMAAEEVALAPGESAMWDGRFRIELTAAGPPRAATGLVVRRLGADGWASLAARDPALRRHPIPPPVRPSLPSLWTAAGVVAVPHLDIAPASRHMRATALFQPGAPLARTRFTVA